MAQRAMVVAKQRLTKELKQIMSEPIDNCLIRAEMSNIFIFHFVLDGISDTPLEGGKYYGTIKFPPEYPFKPPAIFLHTKNGIIQTDESICTSFSEYHPESWQPAFGPRTAILGMFVFLEDCLTGKTGSATQIFNFTPEDIALAAKQSKANTLTNGDFCRVFPDLVEEWSKEIGTTK